MDILILIIGICLVCLLFICSLMYWPSFIDKLMSIIDRKYDYENNRFKDEHEDINRGGDD